MYEGRKASESLVHSGSSRKFGIVRYNVHIGMIVAEAEKTIIKPTCNTVYGTTS